MVRVARFADLTSTDISGVSGEDCVAILPVGAIEQHGPHLPTGTDYFIAEGLVSAAVAQATSDGWILVLPTQCIGDSVEHRSFHGTLSLRTETLIDAWTGIGTELCRNGIHKLIIVNAHGGQPQVVDIVALRLRTRNAMLVVRGNYMNWPLPDGTPADPGGIHGGMLETSMMLQLHPELVHMDKAAEFRSRTEELASSYRKFGHDGRAGFAWMMEDLNHAGVAGRANEATRELGALLMDHYASILAQLIDDTLEFDRIGHFRLA